MANVKSGTTKVIFTAKDGYSAEVSLGDVLACADCLLAFTDTPGILYAVMPGFEGGAWVKEIVSLEVK
jgi:hypothetical protein